MDRPKYLERLIEKTVSRRIDERKYYLSSSNSNRHIYGMLGEIGINHTLDTGNDILTVPLPNDFGYTLDRLLSAGMKLKRVNFLGFERTVKGRELEAVKSALNDRMKCKVGDFFPGGFFDP